MNCTDDLCHLAWIFENNLLQSVFNAACSNGTLFIDLDPESFADCFVSHFFILNILYCFKFNYNVLVQIDSTIEPSPSTESTNKETSSSEFIPSTVSSWFTDDKITSKHQSIQSSNVNLLTRQFFNKT